MRGVPSRRTVGMSEHGPALPPVAGRHDWKTPLFVASWFMHGTEKQRPFGTDLESRLSVLGVNEDDLEEEFVRGSGSGGQKINKTSSCVVLRHRPSGIVIRCQRERSQQTNRVIARERLCARLEEIRLESKKQKNAARALARHRRRMKRRRGALKERVLADKKRRSQKKNLRRKPRQDE